MRWTELVEALETKPGNRWADLEVLPPAERHQVLEEWNRTEISFPAELCVS